jgi:hypothetical protein
VPLDRVAVVVQYPEGVASPPHLPHEVHGVRYDPDFRASISSRVSRAVSCAATRFGTNGRSHVSLVLIPLVPFPFGAFGARITLIAQTLVSFG